MLDEFFECEDAVKADPDFQAALAKRGVSDMSLVMVDPWSAGWYGDESSHYEGRRVLRAMAWVRSAPGDNGYAHPIEGVAVIFDLNTQEVVEVIDTGVVPVPPQPGNYAREFISQFSETGDYRKDLKPFEVVQPDGPSFRVSGHEVQWQKWSFRIGFTPREGLVLYTVGYEDGGRVRPILYRAALCDMVVPYGDPGYNHYHKNAFDCGEYGIGMLANALELGCDCLGEIRYFDCLHDQQPGRSRQDAQRRVHARGRLRHPLEARGLAQQPHRGPPLPPPRRLVHLHGRQLRVRVLLVLLPGRHHPVRDQAHRHHEHRRLPPGETRKYGTLVAPGLYAPTTSTPSMSAWT